MWPAGGEQPMAMGRGPTGPSSTAAAAAPSSGATTTTLAAQQQHSPLQSPVPYLFGGLAAMLGLIALSLLALACSYWKLSGSFSAGEAEDDVDAGHHQARRASDADKSAAAGKAGDKWLEHVVVIMAGDERPTFLAMPASGRADDDAAASCISGGLETRCVECGARARPAAGLEDDALSRSEQSAGSGNSGT